MTNDPPDDGALAAYEARAHHHAGTIALADATLAGLRDHPARAELMARALMLREQAQRNLHVMQALAAAWHRDKAERQTWYVRWEREIRERYRRFRN